MKNELEMIAACGATEAQMIAELLRNNGIESTLQSYVASNPWPTDLGEVRVWVNAADSAQAQELVDAFFTPAGKDELAESDDDLGFEDPDDPTGFTV